MSRLLTLPEVVVDLTITVLVIGVISVFVIYRNRHRIVRVSRHQRPAGIITPASVPFPLACNTAASIDAAHHPSPPASHPAGWGCPRRDAPPVDYAAAITHSHLLLEHAAKLVDPFLERPPTLGVRAWTERVNRVWRRSGVDAAVWERYAAVYERACFSPHAVPHTDYAAFMTSLITILDRLERARGVPSSSTLLT
eukprot:gb/GECH01011226.1/.p1 GENE.gb/GECH01011226.1/~~gb/GECH01011226.1/.p1  ORF type:complete len:196 (+),score=34.52 gb/GECH01011226.1/:1-588(+)